MNYILNRTDAEMQVLCDVISWHAVKDLIKKNQKVFGSAINGWNLGRIQPPKALQLILDFRNNRIVGDYFSEKISKALSDLTASIESACAEGQSKLTAEAQCLLNSKFGQDPALYLKLTERGTDQEYLTLLTNEMERLKENSSETKETSEDTNVANAQELTDLQKRLEETENSLQAEKDAGKVIADSLEAMRHEKETLQSEADILRAQLSALQERVSYDDRDAEAFLVESEHQHISLCEVGEFLNYYGEQQKCLIRLADIDLSGKIHQFTPDKELPRTYGNRDRLFDNERKSNLGEIAVWEWDVYENPKKAGTDRVDCYYLPALTPIEIIILPAITSIEMVIECLKSGLSVETSGRRLLFAYYTEANEIDGILCGETELERKDGGKLYFAKHVVKLPRYRFSSGNILHLDNRKTFLNHLRPGVPVELVQVTEPLEIVKSKIKNRSTWPYFNKLGKSHREHQQVTDFLSQFEPQTLVEDIQEALGCTQPEAEEYLQEYLKRAKEFSGGSTWEDKILEAHISVNPQLTLRCKELLRKEWEAEQEKTFAEANAKLQDINAQHSKAEKERKQAEDKKNELLKQINQFEIELKEKQLYAQQVEDAVNAKIKAAQENAAEFMASIAFTLPQSAPTPITVEATSPKGVGYHSGTSLGADVVDQVGQWNIILDIAADEFITAGVDKAYSRPLAAFLYAAYLHKKSVLLAGPGATAIAEAFTRSVTGRTPGWLDCGEGYSAETVKACYDSEDAIVCIAEPFHTEWVQRLPRMMERNQKFFLAVHPYGEDIAIEPKSLFNYLLPIYTEIFVTCEAEPEEQQYGGIPSAVFEPFDRKNFAQRARKQESCEGLLKIHHAAPLVRTRLADVLYDMELMLDPSDIIYDYKVLFGILPYACATLQLPVMMEKLDEMKLSKNLKQQLTELYGDI